MTREGLFEFAKKNGWDKVLEVGRETHTLSEIAAKLNKKEGRLQIELRAMCAMGLMRLVENPGKKCLYITTILGVKFLQEENKKVGRTYSCQWCGTTTGQPHICPIIYPEFW